jgi:hypothetical protein
VSSRKKANPQLEELETRDTPSSGLTDPVWLQHSRHGHHHHHHRPPPPPPVVTPPVPPPAVAPFAAAQQIAPGLWFGADPNTSTTRMVLTGGALDLALTESSDNRQWTAHITQGSKVTDFTFAPTLPLDLDLSKATSPVNFSMVGTVREGFNDHAYVGSTALRFGPAGASALVEEAFIYGPALSAEIIPYFNVSGQGDVRLILKDVYVYGNSTLDLGGNGSTLVRDDFVVTQAPYGLPGGGHLVMTGL